jgi:hypothetical protein
LGPCRVKSITVKLVIENSRMNPNWLNMYRSTVYVVWMGVSLWHIQRLYLNMCKCNMIQGCTKKLATFTAQRILPSGLQTGKGEMHL